MYGWLNAPGRRPQVDRAHIGTQESKAREFTRERVGCVAQIVTMKPYYEESGIVIYHGDCRDVLPSLPKVDLVLADPPFGIGFSEYKSHDDNREDNIDLLSTVLAYTNQMVVDGWHCWFTAEKRWREWGQMFPAAARLLVYPKTFVQIYKMAGPQYAVDFALFWASGKPRIRDDSGRNWAISNTTVGNLGIEAGHPCPRPEAQIRHAVTVLSEAGATVLDPFMGSGTTLRAAKDLGRQAIGIEIEEKYCEIAANRLRQEVLRFA